jgi:hypothetical protein
MPKEVCLSGQPAILSNDSFQNILGLAGAFRAARIRSTIQRLVEALAGLMLLSLYQRANAVHASS